MNICILYVVDLKSSLGVIVKQETIQKRNETKRDTTETKRDTTETKRNKKKSSINFKKTKQTLTKRFFFT
jgi:CO dehydrogenase nickel-insertion accessory protein CooC1